MEIKDQKYSDLVQSFRHLTCDGFYRSIGTHIWFVYGLTHHYTNSGGFEVPKGQLAVHIASDNWKIVQSREILASSADIDDQSADALYMTHLRGTLTPVLVEWSNNLLVFNLSDDIQLLVKNSEFSEPKDGGPHEAPVEVIINDSEGYGIETDGFITAW